LQVENSGRRYSVVRRDVLGRAGINLGFSVRQQRIGDGHEIIGDAVLRHAAKNVEAAISDDDVAF
jgi:hypothetical protein